LARENFSAVRLLPMEMQALQGDHVFSEAQQVEEIRDNRLKGGRVRSERDASARIKEMSTARGHKNESLGQTSEMSIASRMR
jgi:hypothetical protein